jgi:NADPH:quinone reductase-like Zn-dependent oxidoreductase
MSNLVTGDRKNFFSLAKHWFHVERINPLRLHDENRMLGGFSLKSLLFPRQPNSYDQTEVIAEVWKQLIHMLQKKQIDPWIDSEWGFDEVKEAMLRLQERKNIGKVVLLPKKKPKPTETAQQHHETQEQTASHDAK